MNISEAQDVCTVLEYVLGDRSTVDRLGLDDDQADARAREAAGRLADRAHKALGAGITRDRVFEAWQNAEFGPWQKRPGDEHA